MSDTETEVHLKGKPSIYVSESPREVHDAVEIAMVDAKAFVVFHDGKGREMFIDPRLVTQIVPYEPMQAPAVSPRRSLLDEPM